MTRDYRANELTLGRRIKPYAEIARNLIEEALVDVEAHARATVDQMAAHVSDFVWLSRSGSVKSAERRLDNLGAALVQTVQRARIEFYVQSHELHRPYLRSKIHQMDVQPTREGAMAVRDALIHGRSLEGDVLHLIGNVKYTLKAALTTAAQDVARSSLRNWRTTTANQIQGKVEGWLGDSSRAIHSSLAYALIKPELRPALK